jgi:uncharacterized protein involved in outer membrane biogenesis
MAGERLGTADGGRPAEPPPGPAPRDPGSPQDLNSPQASAPVAPPRRRRWLRIALWALSAVAVYALLGFVVAPRVAQSQLVERLGAELGRPVAIERIEFNPFTLLLRVHGLSVSEPSGGAGFAGFDRLDADLSWRSLYRLAPVLSSVSLHRPHLRLARDEHGVYTIQDLLDKWAARPPSEPGPPPRFSVANIVVDEGRFEFDDAQLDVRHEVASLALTVPYVSSLPVDEQVWVEPSLRATVNGAPFSLEGKSLPFSPTRDATLDVDLDGFDLTDFVGYSPVPLPVALRAGRLDTALKITFSQPTGATPTVAVTGSANLAGLDLRQPDGTPLLATESIAAEPIAVAWPDNRYTIGRVTISAPEIAVRRQAGQRFLEPVLAAVERSRTRGGARAEAAPASPAAPPTPAADAQASPPATAKTPPATPGPQWAIDEIVVNGGKVAFDDMQFQPKPLRLNAGGVEATMRKLVSDPDVPAEFELAFGLANGESGRATGTALWQQGTVDARAQLSGIALARWWWLAEPRVALDALDGTLALAARVRVTPVGKAGTAVRVEEGSAKLKALSLRQRWDKRTLIALPQLDLDGVTIDLSKRTIDLGTLSTKGGQLLVRRDDAGRFNLQRVAAADPRETAAPERRVGGGAESPAAASGDTAAAAAGEWTLGLGKLAIEDFGVELEDQRGGRAANLRVRAIDIGASGVSSADGAPRAKVQVKARVDRRGSLNLAGDLGLRPLAATLRVAARDLVIVPLQPYFTEYVNALVSSGAVSADGTLRFSVPGKGAPRVTWKGRTSIADFAAVTKEASTELLRWKSLTFDEVDFDSEPLAVDVGSIALTSFYARVILSAEGRLNLRDLLVDRGAGSAATPRSPTAPVAAAASAAAPTAADAPLRRKLRVGGVQLTDGNIDFSDFFVQPNYSANLTGMNGQVSEITPEQAGDVELRGRVDQTGTVQILGKVNPLAEPLFLDLKADASDIDLPRLSPYSAKYVGYGIEKGKLSAKVAYKVENRQLTAENNIVLDQLTFGDKVESPDAIKLPVLFAVSLLKDRNGVIDVNLPISGSLDDPKFSVGGIVLRIIVNLIVKAVTAPFTLIANLAGAGGAELSWIGFEPGRSGLAPAALKKLEAVAKALNDRPGLKLDLAGRADPAADRDALRQLALERAVKAQKLRETVSAGADSAAIDQVTIEPQEYEKYLGLAWRAAKFEKPRNAIGLVKSQPRAEMERMMLAHIEAGDADLTRLANDRAQQAKDWLETTGKIPGERLFIVAPRIGGGASRADEAAQAARPAAGAGAADGSADGSAEAPAAGAAKGAPAPIPRVDLSLK